MKPVVAVVGLIAWSSLFAMAYAAQQYTIEQADKSFSQAELTVKVGDSILFKNSDGVAHNVFSKSPGNTFNSKLQQPGAELPVTFSQAGDVEVRCAIHPNMKMTVHVAP